MAGPLRDFQPVRLELVAGGAEVGLWNDYVERFHPLGYRGAFGYRLRYFIHAGAQPLGCILLAGAAKAIAVRDRWIGWDARTRLCNLARVINNSRLLIFPHVHLPHLASHALGQLARRVPADWQQQFASTGDINTVRYIAFLKQLIKNRTTPLILIVDRVAFHQSKELRDFVRAHRAKLRVFFLPTYSPELNPDEQVWNTIKD